MPALSECEYWLGVLDSLGGATSAAARQIVATRIWDAPEHRMDEVAAYYQTLLGRSDGGDAGAAFWVNELEAGIGEFLS